MFCKHPSFNRFYLQLIALHLVMLVAAFVMATNVRAAVVLPIEVLGSDGTIETATVNVANATGATSLWLQVYNLNYPNPVVSRTKGSIQVNSGPWIALTNATVEMPEVQRRYGGIGGGFHTLKLTVQLPAGTVVTGQNVVRFRFDGTDGVSAGYRVLRFNFLAGTTPLVSESEFINDDPSTWTAPANADPLRGKAIWESAVLMASPLEPTRPLQARCMDCHARDGRDLKYFNFSNKSIQVRAAYHGLTEQAGRDIAAYIRTLNVPAPRQARPWNPPYQPGPGLDAKPLQEWSAGAGIDAVLDHDRDILPYLFPGGNITKDIARPDGNIPIREIPIEIQFPDWNHWLPQTHPKDAWSDFTGSQLDTHYSFLRSKLAGGEKPRNNVAQGQFDWVYGEGFGIFGLRLFEFNFPKTEGANVVWSPQHSRRIYDNALWLGVKTWEMMQEFDLERYGPVLFGNLGEARGWFQGYVFDFSPNLLHIPRDGRGINGDAFLTTYLSSMWYQVQITLYSHRYNYGQRPMDWGYTWGFFKDTSYMGGGQSIFRYNISSIKSGQMINNGVGPERPPLGWNPMVFDPSRLVHPSFVPMWGDTPVDIRRQLSEAVIGAWIDKSVQYAPYRYMSNLDPIQGTQQGIVDPSSLVTGAIDGSLGDRIWYMVPQFRKLGVNESLLNRVIDWAKTLYPKSPWDLLREPTLMTNPFVVLDNPYDGTTFSGPLDIPIRPHVTGFLTPPAKLEFYINDVVKIGEAPRASNGEYTFIWPNVQPGKYAISARAVSAEGTISSFTRRITVNGVAGPNRAPAVVWSLPGDQTNLPSNSSVTLEARAVDNDLNDDVAKVEYFANGVKIAEQVNRNWYGNFGYVWNNIPDGTYLLTAKATDKGGLATMSTGITLKVGQTVDTIPPGPPTNLRIQ